VEGKYPLATVLRNQHNRGVAGGRNVGARWVLENLDAEFVIFLDNDSLIEPSTVQRMVSRASEDPRIGLVAPKAYRTKGDGRLLSAGGLRFNAYTGVLVDYASGEVDQGQHDQPRYIQACPGFAFLVRREVFDAIGFFDEYFNPYGWEDADFSLRAGYAGYRSAFAPLAVVYHLGGRVGRGPISDYEFHKARSMFYFMRRHTSLVQWVTFLALLPFRAVGRVIQELSRGNFRTVATWLTGIRPGTKKKRQ